MMQDLLLVAGQSLCFGADKRLALVDGRPMALVCALAMRAALDDVLVVPPGATRHRGVQHHAVDVVHGVCLMQAERIGAQARGPGIQVFRASARIGRLRMRLPVAAKMALVTAGAMGGVPGSPMPPGASPLWMMRTSTCGVASKRSTR